MKNKNLALAIKWKKWEIKALKLVKLKLENEIKSKLK